MLLLVTPTRLDNVISKLGRVSVNNPKIKKRLVELFIEDALESFGEMYPNQWQSLTPSYQDKLKKSLEEAAIRLVAQKL